MASQGETETADNVFYDGWVKIVWLATSMPTAKST